jgi:hypothetical protein
VLVAPVYSIVQSVWPMRQESKPCHLFLLLFLLGLFLTLALNFAGRRVFLRLARGFLCRLLHFLAVNPRKFWQGLEFKLLLALLQLGLGKFLAV